MTQAAEPSSPGSPSEPRSRSYRLKGSITSVSGSEQVACSATSPTSNTASSCLGALKEEDRELLSTKAAWKSSKLFSKTLANIEKAGPAGKLASNSIVSIEPPLTTAIERPKVMLESVGPSSYVLSQQKKDQWKVLKLKLSSMRKKSTSEESNSELGLPSSLSIPRQDRSQRGSTSSITSQNSTLKVCSVSGGRKNSQDDGIVCKHEDLLHLLTEASKQQLVKTKSNDSSNPASPTRTFPPAHHSSSSSHTATSNGSNDGSSSSLPRRSTLKLHGALTEKDRLPTDKELSNQQCGGVSFSSPSSGLANFATCSTSSSSTAAKRLSSGSRCNETERAVKSSGIEALKAASPVPEIRTEDADRKSCTGTEEDEEEEQDSNASSSEEVAAQVKWDEEKTVNAAVLGDAIEAFLKGISAAPFQASPTPPPVVEKRVSFKKC